MKKVLKFIGACLFPALLIVPLLFLVLAKAPVASAQIYPDSGVSNIPGGGWTFGKVSVLSTQSAGTNVILGTTNVPLGFFGAHSTNKQIVTVAFGNTPPVGTNFDQQINTSQSNLANTVLSLLKALRAYGLIITN